MIEMIKVIKIGEELITSGYLRIQLITELDKLYGIVKIKQIPLLFERSNHNNTTVTLANKMVKWLGRCCLINQIISSNMQQVRSVNQIGKEV